MNTPTTSTETGDLAALRAECDVLRLVLSHLLLDKINNHCPDGTGYDVWCGQYMADAAAGLAARRHETPERHLEAFSRFCDSVNNAVEPLRPRGCSLHPMDATNLFRMRAAVGD
jgi:hypothetical protein